MLYREFRRNFLKRTKRSACGTLAPSAVAEGNIFLSRECASRPEGFLLYGNSRGISIKVKNSGQKTGVIYIMN
nr:hypothetical protein [Lachnospiraceae bacterium]